MNLTKIGDELRCSIRVRSFCSTKGIRRITVKLNEHDLIWKSYWTPVSVNKYKYQIKHEPPCKTNEGMNQTSFLIRNHSGHHNMELKTQRHVSGLHEKHEPH